MRSKLSSGPHFQTIRAVEVDVPAPEIKRDKYGSVIEIAKPIPPLEHRDGAYWPVFEGIAHDGAEPVVLGPKAALAAVEAGARFEDREGATAILADLHERARWSMLDGEPYFAVLTAHDRAVKAERAARAAAIIGEPEIVVPKTLTLKQMSQIFQVHEDTIRRWSGNSLPAPMKADGANGALRWNARVVADLLNRAAS